MQRRRPLRERFGAPSFGRRVPRFNFEALRQESSPGISQLPKELLPSQSRRSDDSSTTFLKVVGGEVTSVVFSKKNSE